MALANRHTHQVRQLSQHHGVFLAVRFQQISIAISDFGRPLRVTQQSTANTDKVKLAVIKPLHQIINRCNFRPFTGKRGNKLARQANRADCNGRHTGQLFHPSGKVQA